MGAAVGADCFCADHAVAGVGVAGYFAFGYLLPEAGPACAGVVFGVAGEQLLVAHYAVVGAIGMAVPVFAAERLLGAGVLGYLVLQRGEAVFQVGWLVGHGFLLWVESERVRVASGACDGTGSGAGGVVGEAVCWVLRVVLAEAEWRLEARSGRSWKSSRKIDCRVLRFCRHLIL